MFRGLQHLSRGGGLGELVLFRLEKRQLRGDLTNEHKYLKARCQEDGIRLVSVMPSNRTTDRGHKLKHREFHLNMRKNFTLRAIEHWNRLPSGCEVSFSGDIQNLPGCNPVQPVTGEPAVAVGLD